MRWEYKVVRVNLEYGQDAMNMRELNRMGAQGWEATGCSFSYSSAPHIVLDVLMKRALKEDR